METESLEVEAAAKINLSLRVKAMDGSGLHPLLSLVQSFDRVDRLRASLASDDELDVGDSGLSPERDNLIWRAVDALRNETGNRQPFAFALVKEIPIAAGLAGGSADAAAALVSAASLLGLGRSTISDVAIRVGADVPFCVRGGFSWMEGHGERLTPFREIPTDYAVAVVVPPFTLETPAVYRRWDEAGEPTGRPVDAKHLPPSLRSHGSLVNDLFPAAVALQPELGDWQADLADRWERPVLLSGSGPALFAFFGDRGEAEEAARLGPAAARASFAASPVGYGVRPTDSVGEHRSH